MVIGKQLGYPAEQPETAKNGTIVFMQLSNHMRDTGVASIVQPLHERNPGWVDSQRVMRRMI